MPKVPYVEINFVQELAILLKLGLNYEYLEINIVFYLQNLGLTPDEASDITSKYQHEPGTEIYIHSPKFFYLKYVLVLLWP